MKTSLETKKEILEIINLYIGHFPEQRFGQILFNLNINHFKDGEAELKDIYNDSDEQILERIKLRLVLLNLK